ncbi:MAG: CHAT domain-containing protein [Gemmatimonadaceae bacterium]|nr:CHAT domain-containing protein [Gemmatimonadaceae bacterium]
MRLAASSGALLLAAAQGAAHAPHAAVAQLPQAVRGDSSARGIAAAAQGAAERGRLAEWGAPWRKRLARDAADRRARYAVATHDRLSYAVAAATAGFARLGQPARAAGTRVAPALPPAADDVTRQAQYWTAALAAQRGRHDEAIESLVMLERTALAENDTLTALDAMLLRAGAILRRQGPLAATPILERGDALRWGDDPTLQVAARCRWAAVHSRRGAREEARRAAREGMARAANAGLLRLAASCRFTLATEFARSGLSDSVAAHLIPAMAAQRATLDLAGLAASSQWAGFYSASLGHFTMAQRYQREAWELAIRAQVADAAAWTALNRAAVALAFRDATATATWLPRADSLMRRLDDPAGRVEVARLQARHALARGDTSASRAALAMAHSLAGRLGDPQLQLAVVASQRASAMRAGAPGEAGKLLRDEAALIDRYALDGWRLSLAATRGELALRQGDVVAARPLLQRAAEQLHPSQHHFRHVIEGQLALTYALEGDGRAAARVARAAAESFDSWRASLADSALRLLTVQAVEGDRWYQAMLEARLVALGEMETAFLLSERRRARELQERLLLAAAWHGDGGGDGRPATSRPHVQLATSAPPTVEALQRAVPDARTAVVTLTLGAGTAPGLAFVLTRDTLAAFALPPREVVAPQVRRLVAQLEGGRPDGGASRRLGDLLLTPLLPLLQLTGTTRVIFVPEGVLHRLPLDVLALPDGRPFLAQFETAVLPAVGVLATLRERAAHARGARAEGSAAAPAVLVLADPLEARVRTGEDHPFAASAVAGGRGGLPRLHGAREEARRLQRAFPAAELRLGPAASENFVRSNVERFDVLHFATHAVVDEWSGATAALQLSPTAGGEDGWLEAGEISAMRLRAALVVLSACRTVGGEVLAGEGVRGLTGAFLEAGVPRVIATAWLVRDRELAPLLGDFYDALARGVSYGAALRLARLDARARGATPATWAAFALVGDPTGTLTEPATR